MISLKHRKSWDPKPSKMHILLVEKLQKTRWPIAGSDPRQSSTDLGAIESTACVELEYPWNQLRRLGFLLDPP